MPRTFAFVLCVLLTSSRMPMSTGQDVDTMRQKAVQFLEVTQSSDGSWSSPTAVGISGLVTASLLQSGKTAEDQLEAVNHFLPVAKKEKGSATQVRFCNVP